MCDFLPYLLYHLCGHLHSVCRPENRQVCIAGGSPGAFQIASRTEDLQLCAGFAFDDVDGGGLFADYLADDLIPDQ